MLVTSFTTSILIRIVLSDNDNVFYDILHHQGCRSVSGSSCNLAQSWQGADTENGNDHHNNRPKNNINFLQKNTWIAPSELLMLINVNNIKAAVEAVKEVPVSTQKENIMIWLLPTLLRCLLQAWKSTAAFAFIWTLCAICKWRHILLLWWRFSNDWWCSSSKHTLGGEFWWKQGTGVWSIIN